MTFEAMEATPPTDIPSQHRDIIELQLDRYYRANEGMASWARIAKRCIEFVEGQQWSAEELAWFEESGREPMTVNKINPLVRLMIGYFRQNRYELRYVPGYDGTGQASTAEALTQLQKSTDEINHQRWVDAEVFAEGIMTGRGFIDTRLTFEDNPLGRLRTKSFNPFATLVDPEAEEYDTEGWQYCMHSRWMAPKDIAVMYGRFAAELVQDGGLLGGAPISGLPIYDVDEQIGPDQGFGLERFWDQARYDHSSGYLHSGSAFDHINRHRHLIRVIECQHYKWELRHHFIDIETGITREIPDALLKDHNRISRILQWAEEQGQPARVIQRRDRVPWFTTTAGDRVLYNKRSPYRRFTLTPYFPYFRRGKTRGMVEDLIQPQRELNARRTAITTILQTQANSGWVYEEDALREEMKEALEFEGGRPGINIEYKSGSKPPERIRGDSVSPSLFQAAQLSEKDLNDVSNINESALGHLDKVQSGRATMARQKQALVGNEGYFDNWARTREFHGKFMLEGFQDHYTEERVVRILGPGEDEIETVINKIEPSGQISNNVALGTYATHVDEQPISASFENAMFETAMELVEAFGPVIPPDYLIDISPLPRKEVLKARMAEREAALAAQQAELAAAGQPVGDGGAPALPPPPASMAPPTGPGAPPLPLAA